MDKVGYPPGFGHNLVILELCQNYEFSFLSGSTCTHVGVILFGPLYMAMHGKCPGFLSSSTLPAVNKS